MSRKKKKTRRAGKRTSRTPPKKRSPGAHTLFGLATAHDRAGRLQKAETLYNRVIRAFPAFSPAHYNLGNLLARQGRMSSACKAYQKAVAADDKFVDAYINLMNALYLTGQYPQALKAGERALSLAAGNAGVHATLAGIYRKLNRPAQVIEYLLKAIAIDPDNPAFHHNLGEALRKADRLPEAATAFEKAVKLDPDNASARHLLSAMRGETPDSAPRKYVVETFDKLSADFDDHLIKDLEYTTPEQLKNVLGTVCGSGQRFSRMLDLGCGTGLSGMAFKSSADHMTGVDLSSKMIALSNHRGIYAALENSEIIDFLEGTADKFDLVVAADVFVYIGNLTPVFRAVKNRLLPGAYFTFSTETCRKEPWGLRSTGRYAHSRHYIRSLAGEKGFEILAEKSSNIRKEKQQWVVGDLYVLRTWVSK